MNLLFQNALHNIPQAVPPIWFMRQAGRYQKSYQKVRERYSFVQICKTPELAAQVALSPILEFDLDVAILFSDILFPLEALGMSLNYAATGAPHLSPLLKDKSSVANLRSPQEAIPLLSFQHEALTATRSLLPNNKSLIGFIGGPFTLFAYAVKGHPLQGFAPTPDLLTLFQPFCEKILPLLRASILEQISSSAEIVMIFDTSAGMLNKELYLEYVLPQLKELVDGISDKVAYYARGLDQVLFDDLFFQSLAGIALDSRSDLARYFNRKGFIQGNFNEKHLLTDSTQLTQQVFNYLNSIRELPYQSNWVCSLGHGVLPTTPEANVHKFIELVRGYFK